MSVTKKQQSIFPDLPRESPAVDKEGNFSMLWSLGFSSLFQALQKNYKNEGILFPALDATSIADIQAIYTELIGGPLPSNIPDISGQTIFDTTNRVPKQFIILFDGATPPNIRSASWLNINVMTFSTRNPNYNVVGPVPAIPGALNWFCYDTVNKILYICTTAGGALPPDTIAVWTAV